MTPSDSVVTYVQNDQEVTEKATDTMRDVAAPTPSDLHNILLVDANGADDATKFVFKSRNNYVYPDVESGVFRENHSKLVGKNEAFKKNFVSKLNDPNFKLVSVGGHGSDDCVFGYIASGDDSPTPILSTTDVTKELATGKIFHFLACSTSNELGPALVENGAIAFVGYKEPFALCTDYQWILQPDCTIDQELIKGKTVKQAVEKAKAEYRRIMNKEPPARA